MNSDLGGPAFPNEETQEYKSWSGMQLVDYFAAQALPSIIDIASHSADHALPTSGDAARMAYDYAESMIVERAKRYPNI